MYTRPGTGGGGFNDGSSYASSSHYSGLPPGHGLPHGLPVTLSAHSSIDAPRPPSPAPAPGYDNTWTPSAYASEWQPGEPPRRAS